MDFYQCLAKDSWQSCRLRRNDYLAAGIDRGLRNANGQGILAGITCISENYGSQDGRPCEGKIFYRDQDLAELVQDPANTYEKTAYLLLTGKMPALEQQQVFLDTFEEIRRQKKDALEVIIRRESGGADIMNMMARSVLALYDYDPAADDITWGNLVRQAVEIIALMPVLSTNIYVQKHSSVKETAGICFDDAMTSAENILYILRGADFTPLEARALDKCLILHAELGGGNNSAFTARVVSSTGTDSYAAIASAICSIKGPKHGGANRKVHAMFRDMEQKVKNWKDPEEVKNYLTAVVQRKAFDRAGLIYGMGHAVFTLSDPRAGIMKKLARELAVQAKREEEFFLYDLVEQLAPEIIQKEKGLCKLFCANVDFYSGLIYDLLGIPEELFTPMFVNARTAGWCAHRLEEMSSGARIMHPAFPYVCGQA